MKLSLLYSNQESLFPIITFRQGLNVIFARVKDPTLKDRDSHNLGKTFLTNVIDFCLLAQNDKDKEHPFINRQDLFGEFTFFLEIETNLGQYITVRRKAIGSSSVSIHVNDKSGILLDLPDPKWSSLSLGLEKARHELNQLLNLTVIEPFDYRKGLRQFLRRQEDYLDEFRTSKFVRGKDKDWKPYIALSLGFDQTLLSRKYDLDEKIEEQIKYRKQLEDDAGALNEEYDELRGIIEIEETVAKKTREELDRFSFADVEAEINEDVITRIERGVAQLNQERYTVDYEIQEIDRSLSSEFDFDIDKVSAIFKEAEIILPDSIVHDYAQLVDFNKRLSSERNKRLKDLKSRLNQRREEIQNNILEFDKERRRALEILSNKESLTKYKDLQRRLLQHEEKILAMRARLAQLDKVTNVNREIAALEQRRSATIRDLEQNIRGENRTYSTIRGIFAESIRQVLNAPALLSVTMNQAGNIDFKTRIIDRGPIERETSESEGTSYKKILCACFDISLLSTYADKSFYRFVYHDGIFEGLDNRKKVSLLRLIRDVCAEKRIQYILTVIDSDLPRDDNDRKLLFSEDEIIRLLHDDGDAGRLFKMSKF
jgi:uncharacterized protein YydD (DUF2326 family)